MKRREFIKVAGTSMGLAGLGLSKPTRVFAGNAKRRRPNILLLFSDQHNASVLGCEGHPDVKTPHLDSLARQGVRFSRAYCQDGICVPSRVSMLTGQYPRTTGVIDNRDRPPLPAQLHPLHKLLSENGYITAAFGKRHLPQDISDGFDETCTTISPKQEPSDESYRDWIAEQGQADAFERDWIESKQSPLYSHISQLRWENTAEAYTALKTIDFIRRAKNKDQPFFCWCSFVRPHQPYTPVAKWAKFYDPAKITLPENLREPVEALPPMMQRWRRNTKRPWCLAEAAKDEQLYRNYISYYYALVTEIDYYIGRVLDCLESQGLAENTIVIYSSDHGDFVGAHGMVEKCALGHNVYEDTLRIPLIMHWPGHFQKALVADDLIELIDLYPTLLELAGIEKPADYDLPGFSLAPMLSRGKRLGRLFAVSENFSQVSIITERYKLGTWIEPPNPNFDFREHGDMLFDRRNDRWEVNNLAGKPQVAGIEKELRGYLKEWAAKTPDRAKQLTFPNALQVNKPKR